MKPMIFFYKFFQRLLKLKTNQRLDQINFISFFFEFNGMYINKKKLNKIYFSFCGVGNGRLIY
ncbi:hypothetical protein BpHYR1_015382 [Brachionus plicatilis]|uniref:Uncharacterized protein n=1 Tax=Brachionus plicatilis TaxID=10195 RepID=A0A3M7PEZ6_BRAPC|nr:hypothetical protein BpHYR1_015382 [Brachionus plicatilis]